MTPQCYAQKKAVSLLQRLRSYPLRLDFDHACVLAQIRPRKMNRTPASMPAAPGLAQRLPSPREPAKQEKHTL